MGGDWRSWFVVPVSLWWLAALLLCLTAPFPAHAEDNDITYEISGGQRSPNGAIDPDDLMHQIVVYEEVAEDGTTSCGFAATLDGGKTYTRGPIPFPGLGFSVGESPSVSFVGNGRALIACNYFDPVTGNDAISVSILDKGASAPSPSNLLLVGGASNKYFGGALAKNFVLNRLFGGGNDAVLTYLSHTDLTGSSLLATITADGGTTWSSPSLVANSQRFAYQASSAFNSSGAFVAWINSDIGGASLMGNWGTFNPDNSLTFGAPPLTIRPVTLPPSGYLPGFQFELSNRVAVGLLENKVVLGWMNRNAPGGFSINSVQSSDLMNFGAPVTINDGPPRSTRFAVFPDFSLNKKGNLKAAFLDNRLGTIGTLLNLFASLSVDGINWTPTFQINDRAIDPNGFGNGGYNIGQGISVDATGTTYGQKLVGGRGWPDVFSHLHRPADRHRHARRGGGLAYRADVEPS